MAKAVIFDLDGTLLDTLQDITDNLNIMLDQFNYPQVTLKETRLRVGSGARNLVKASLPQDLTESQIDECLAVYNRCYTASVSPKTKLFDGIDVVLLTLKERGYKLAILTNKPQPTTETVYREHLEKFKFDYVFGSQPGFKHKPDPESTKFVLQKLGVENPNDAYFVGDGETDVMTSINANTKGIAVLWGYRDLPDLQKAGATEFAKSPLDLLSKII